MQRLLEAVKERGDKAVVHRLRGKPSNRKIEEAIEEKAMKVLSMPVYEGFGPTLAAEYLGKKHGIEASKETVRKWMMRGKLWRAKKEKVQQVHAWRPRRSRWGELVQWDTSEHDWLEGRGEQLYLIANDRRCDQPIVRAFCATRFDRGEPETVVELSGEVRAASGVLLRTRRACSARRRSANGMNPG